MTVHGRTRMLPQTRHRRCVCGDLVWVFIVTLASATTTYGQNPTAAPSAIPTMAMSVPPTSTRISSTSPSFAPTHNGQGVHDDDDYTDSPTPPNPYADEIAPCIAVYCNASTDCDECSPANTTLYAFCEVIVGQRSHCTVCEACDYNITTPAVEGVCGLPSVCNVATPISPPTAQPAVSIRSSDPATDPDVVTAIVVPVLVLVIVLAVIGTLHFARKIRNQNTDGIKHLLADDNEDVVITRGFRNDDEEGTELDDFQDYAMSPYAGVLPAGKLSNAPLAGESRSKKAVAMNGLGYFESESAI